MDFNFFAKDLSKTHNVETVLQRHFENIQSGNFDSDKFFSELQAIPPQDFNYRECIQSLMKLTKDKVTGTNNYKMVHKNLIVSLEKMMEILLENFTVKKSGVNEVLFFPNEENEAKIIQYINSAQKSIYVCVFTITNDALCTALLEAYLRGVNVRLITDDEELRMMGSNVRDLSEEGVSIRTDASAQSLMHNKFVIIDQKILMTGSYGWGVSASTINHENVIIVENEYLVESFTNEFNKLWKQFSPHDFDDTECKAKRKTRLYQKYQESVVQREKQQKKVLISNNDQEEAILDMGGINENSKKISKFKKIKDFVSSKFSKKSAKSVEEPDKEEQETTAKSSETAKSFLKLILTLFYIFSLIVFVRYRNSPGMNIEAS